jgi:hypothetical protein
MNVVTVGKLGLTFLDGSGWGRMLPFRGLSFDMFVIHGIPREPGKESNTTFACDGRAIFMAAALCARALARARPGSSCFRVASPPAPRAPAHVVSMFERWSRPRLFGSSQQALLSS